MHASDLRHRDMTLVDDSDEVVRKEIQQTKRTGAGTATVEIPRIVLNARTIAQLPHHLNVVVHPVLQPLGLEPLPHLTEILRLTEHIVLNLHDGSIHLVLRGDEDVGREDGDLGDLLDTAAGDRVEALDGVDLIVPEHDAVGDVGISRKDVERLSLDTELALGELDLVTGIEGVHKRFGHIVAATLLSTGDIDDVLAEVVGVADTIKARHRRDHDDVSPTRHQSRGGAQAQLLDIGINRKVFFNISVSRRNESLRLVVVVIGDEIFHGILREERLELAIELRRQGLVVAQDERRPVELRQHIGNSEGLARAGHPEQCLGTVAPLQSLDELLDGLRLVARGLEVRYEFKVHASR